jgi:hypothetical protein
MADYALVLNPGSASLKFSVYERLDDQEWQLSSRGQIEGSRILHRKLLGRISDFKMESQTTMHYVIDLDPAARIVRVTVDGVLTDELLVETYGTLERLVSGENPYSGIFDFSKVMEDLVSSEGIRALARKVPIILSGKLRVVVASTPGLHGLFRMYEMSRDGMRADLQVVGSIDEAYRMFGVHPEDFSQRLFPGYIAA